MKIKRFAFAVAMATATAFTAPAVHASTITFENYLPPTVGFLLNSTLSSGGFNFVATSGWFLLGDNSNTPDSGSTSILVDSGSPASFTMNSTDRAAFSLNSFRAAEGRNAPGLFFAVFGSTDLLVTGVHASGGSIVASFAMDQLASNNANTDFQLFSLNGFDNLSSVTFSATGGQSGYSFSIDDITVNAAAVPEPTSIALLGFGLFGLGMALRRK